MKNRFTLPIALVAAAVISHANAATILATNQDFTTQTYAAVYDLSNVQIGSGFVAVGYFNISDAAITTSNASQLQSAFQMFGSSSGTSYNVGGSGWLVNGIFDFSASAPILGGSSFIGQNIYLVVGNNTNFGTSTQAFIYRLSTTFSADPSSPININFTSGPTGGTTILGTTGLTRAPQYSGAGSGNANNPVNNPNCFQTGLIAIPEPSAALMGLIGCAFLLRRRRC